MYTKYEEILGFTVDCIWREKNLGQNEIRYWKVQYIRRCIIWIIQNVLANPVLQYESEA
jgi:hypothetical protein